jgi:TRAP-type C4-dicarboxylate transport system permease small subunit
MLQRLDGYLVKAGLALREGRHAAIDMFQDRLPPRLQRALRALIGAGILVFFIVLGYFGVQMSIFGWSQETIATQIPTGIPHLAIPIGAAVFCLHLTLTFREWMDKRWEEIPIPEEEATPEENAA